MSQLNASQGRVLTKIIDEAQRQGVPPDIAGAIGWKESLLGERVIDPYGKSLGVMQLKRIVLDQLQSIGAIGANVRFSDLSNENLNIKAGIGYFKYIMNKYPDWPLDVTLAAWNGGETAVRRVWSQAVGSLSSFFRKLIEANLSRAVNFVSKVKIALIDIQDAISTRIQKAGVAYDEEDAANRFLYFTDFMEMTPESELTDEEVRISSSFGDFGGLSFAGGAPGRGDVIWDPWGGTSPGWGDLFWGLLGGEGTGAPEQPSDLQTEEGISWSSLALGGMAILLAWQLMNIGGQQDEKAQA